MLNLFRLVCSAILFLIVFVIPSYADSNGSATVTTIGYWFQSSGVRNLKIASLPPNNDGNLTHLHIIATINPDWSAAKKAYIDATFANRGGFLANYTIKGYLGPMAEAMTAYQNSDGTVDIYLHFEDPFPAASFTILEHFNERIYSSPADVGTTPPGTLIFSTSTAMPLTAIDASGQMGLGTVSPGAKLEVNGNIKLTANSGASITFPDGTVQSTAWNGTTCGGDYAESVDVNGDMHTYTPGDVIVIDENGPEGSFKKSTSAYSSLVTGVYSTRPGLTGRRQDPQSSKTDEIPMAMMGIVPVKVTDEGGPIHRGDLLVTSSTPGYAMRGSDRSKLTGTVVGKALGSLAAGSGMIEAVISLQ